METTNNKLIPDKFTFTYNEAFKILGFSRNIGYQLIGSGELQTTIINKRPKISRKNLIDYATRKGLI